MFPTSGSVIHTPLQTIHLLSENFSYTEAIRSNKATELGIDNTPSQDVLEIMYKTAVKMEKVRNILGDLPISINSWNRVPDVNVAVGGTRTSQHCKGEAVDFTCKAFGTPLDICRKLIENKDLIGYDQLILEHTWVHISFAILTGNPRSQVLSLLANKNYAVGLTDELGNPY